MGEMGEMKEGGGGILLACVYQRLTSNLCVCACVFARELASLRASTACEKKGEAPRLFG